MIQKKLITPIQKQGATKTGSGTNDHNVLFNRELINQHTINAITGLQTEIDKIATNTDSIDAGYLLLQTNTDDIQAITDRINANFNIRPLGDWAPGTYVLGDTVRNDGRWYSCIVLTTDLEPTSGNKSFWFKWKGDLPTDLATMTWVNDNYANKNAGTSNTMEGDYLFKGKMTSIQIPVNNPDVSNKEYTDRKADKSIAQLIQALWTFAEYPKATAIANSVKPTDEKDFITLKWLDEKVDFNIEDNVEYITNETWNGKIVYRQRVTKGDITVSKQIPATGVLVDGVSEYLLEGGIIRRLNLYPQIHTLGNVSNLPDQHTSIVWYNIDAKRIEYYYNQSMTLTEFKNAPFIANLKYTKV